MTDAPAIIQNSNGIWMLEGEQLWDSDILPVCLGHIKEGDTVIDAGAWIGGHTMAYADKVRDEGKVFAFEPNPNAFHCLMRNTKQFDYVHCFPIALGDKYELVELSAKKGWQDSGHIGHATKDYIPDAEKIAEVVMRTLDYHELAPNFIKIDVEGCELKVLKGAAKTIEKSRPIMVVEVNEMALQRQGTTRSEILFWMGYNGYATTIIEHNADNLSDVYNLLCIPK